MSKTTPLYIKTPGKLMVAGEFAVLEPFNQLVVMAVDRFVYTTLENSTKNRLILEDFNLHLIWSYSNGKIRIHSNDHRIKFVKEAMNVAFRFLAEHSIHPNYFSLTIKSELDDESGHKYGLGSSAAVVTSVITALLKNFLPEEPLKELIFKLSAISHIKTQGNGSGADIAASTYGGVLQYSSFQAEWLLSQYKNMNSLTELVEKNWIYLSIKQIDFPKSLQICIGWTGKPASTANLVTKILHLKENSPIRYQEFLEKSAKAVNIFLKGLEQENIPIILEGVKLNRRCLAEVGVNAHVEIETPLLRKLSNLSEQLGGAGKPSGAGGGDCGIAFMPTNEGAQHLIQAWNQVRIKPLNLSIYEYGKDSF